MGCQPRAQQTDSGSNRAAVATKPTLEVRNGYPNDQQMESDRSHDLHGFIKEFLIEPCNATINWESNTIFCQT